MIASIAPGLADPGAVEDSTATEVPTLGLPPELAPPDAEGGQAKASTDYVRILRHEHVPDPAQLRRLPGDSDAAPTQSVQATTPGVKGNAEDVATGSHNKVSGSSISDSIADVATRVITQRPCGFCCSCCLLILALLAIVVVSGAMSFNEEGPKDWDILDEPITTSADLIQVAAKEADCVSFPDPCLVVEERSQTDVAKLGMVLVYESRSGPIFTPANLQHICRFENVLIGAKGYPEVCALKPGRAATVRAGSGGFGASDCLPQADSIVTKFYAAAGVDSTDCPLLSAAVVDTVAQQIYQGLTQAATYQYSGIFVGSDAVRAGNWSGGETSRTRSIFALGYPLHGRDDVLIELLRPDVLEAYHDAFYTQAEEDVLQFFAKDSNFLKSPYRDHFVVGDVEVNLVGRAYFTIDLSRTINTDIAFALFSILFVYVCLIYHTGSFFVGSVALWQIVMSIPVSLVFYRFVLRITYFRQLHALLIFIMLGVGADDVFVFSDAWRQSKTLGDGVLSGEAAGVSAAEEKMASLRARLRHAYKQTLVAVFNTSVTTGTAFLASAVSPIMPIKTMGVYAVLLVFCNFVFAVTLTPACFVVSELYLPSIPWPCAFRRRPADERPRDDATDKLYSRSAPWILRRGVVPFFKLRFAAVSSVFLLLAWGIANVIMASQLGTPTEGMAFFHEDHMNVRSNEANRNDYAAGVQAIYNEMTVSFGVKGINRDLEPGVDPWKPHEWFGVPVWDDAFDLSTAEAQQFLRNFCARLRAQDCSAEGCQPIGHLVQQAGDSVSCFIEHFDEFNNGTSYTGSDFTPRLLTFRKTHIPTNRLEQGSWRETLGFVDGRLRYVQVRARLSLMTWKGDEIKEGVLDQLEAFLDVQRESAPQGLSSIYQSVPFDFLLLETARGLVSGLFVGFAICLPVGFLVLLLATRNIIISFLALCTVAMIVASVLGYCFMAGWSLGAGECVAGTIVIGLAIDYVIHLGHMYLEASRHGLHTRSERWEFAINTMGETVLAGAATTLAAGLVMQFCQIVFFNQMSNLMVCTVVYSWVYATGLFMAFLKICGPERDQGDITWMFARASRTREATSHKLSWLAGWTAK